MDYNAMLKNYLKIAGRNLWRHKGYTLINTVGLAVGMACCILIMLYVQDELRFDTHHVQARNIYRTTIEINNNGTLDRAAVTSPPIGPKLQADYPEIKQVVRLSNPSRNLLRKGEVRAYEENGLFADSTLFSVFTYPLTAGNPRTALTEPHSIVLSQELANRYFGHQNPVGQVMEIELDSLRQVKVSGVLAPIPGNTHIRPSFILPFHSVRNNSDNWWAFAFHTYLLTDGGFNARKFEAKLPAFVKKYMPVPAGSPPPPSLHLQPLLEVHLASEISSQITAPGERKNIYLFSALALFIILLACINFMNLATARSQNRAKEVGVRKVIGATRRQLITQFLSESVLLTLVSLLVAVVLVQFSLPAFNRLSGKLIELHYFNNAALLAGLLLLTGVVGLAAGLYPALFLSAFKPVQVLKGRLAATSQGAVLRKSLVVLQFAISIGLIVGTVVVYSQMRYMQNKRLGFDKEQLLTIPLSGQVSPRQANTLKNEFLRLPGVQQGTMAVTMPGFRAWWQTSLAPAGDPAHPIIGFVFQTDFDYIHTMGIGMAAGRTLDHRLRTDSTRSVLLNEAAVRAFGWPSPAAAIGKKLDLGEEGQLSTVVGVVKDFNFQTLRSKVDPAIFTIARDQVRYLVLRISPKGVSHTLQALQQKWQEFDARHPFEYSFVDENLSKLYQTEMRLGKIFGIFSALAIVIACLGLFGLASFTTEQRTKEIGIRKVLGASVSGIVAMLSRDFLKLVMLANLIAWPLAWWGMRQWLQDFAYRTPISWWIFGLAAVLALLIALLTVSFHAFRAAISNPVQALRNE
jgi:putative ABC transport system permease protein